MRTSSSPYILLPAILLVAASSSAFTPLLVKPLSKVTTSRSSVCYSQLFKAELFDQSDISKKDDTEEEVMTVDEFRDIRNLAHTLGRGSSSAGKIDTIKSLVLSETDFQVEARHHAKQHVVQTDTAQHSSSTVPLGIAKALPDSTTDDGAIDSQSQNVFQEVIAILTDLEQVFEGSSAILGYDTYEKHREYPNVDLAGAMKQLKGAPPRDYIFSFKKTIRAFIRALRTIVGLSMTADDVEKAPTYEKKIKAFFTKKNLFWFFPNPLDLVPLPTFQVQHWEEDKEFCRQFLNGVNPLMVEVVRDPMSQVTKELRDHLTKTYNLHNLAKEGNLFKVDYEWLLGLEKNPHPAKPKSYNKDSTEKELRYYQQAPQVIFKKSATGDLEVLAVQLERQSDKPNEVFAPETTSGDEWLFVKVCVTNCDSQFHEWVSHLGKTHLTMEPHIVAIHNTLKQSSHPIYTFLEPMMRDTLLLNYAARRTLAAFGPESFGDRQSSVGTGQFMQLIERYWKNYDFFPSTALDQELASRGFTEDVTLDGYLYQRDGMAIWNAYGKFANDFVSEVYERDADVKADSGLQEWADETCAKDKAYVRGFPSSFDDKATLAKTLQTLWWICSGLHAAVNFPQYDFYAYAPNKPLHMRQSLDHYRAAAKAGTFTGGLREWIFSQAMPSLKEVKESITTVSVLTLPSKHTIDKLDNTFHTLGKRSYADFKKELEAIGNTINARNQKNKESGNAVYHYLHPSVIPASIDI